MFRIKKHVCLIMGFLLAVSMFFTLISCTADTDDEADEPMVPRYGGVLQLGYAEDPGHFDLHLGTGRGYRIIDQAVERLFERDASYEMHGDLAESHTVSNDGLIHTVKLHKGVRFHNGKELSAEDVVASIERMLRVITSVLEIARVYDSVVAVDRYTVEFHFTQPHAEFKEMLSGPASSIYPKELCEKFPDRQFPHNEIIGTGPYKLIEYIPDRYVRLDRFTDYVPRGEDLYGRAGRKNAYVDSLVYHIIPDTMVRMMGVENGQYHWGWGIDFMEYQRILDLPGIYPAVTLPWEFMQMGLNCAHPPTNNVKVRLAIQAAISAKEIMDATLPAGLYSLSCSKMWVDVKKWYSEAGCEYYNQGNPGRAKQLLEEAGYSGEPIVILGMTEYAFLKNAAVVAAKQLENAGFNVDLRLSDVGTFIANYLDRNRWNIGVSIAPVYSTPTSFGWTREEHTGWWKGETPRKLELGELLRTETDHARRLAIWEELQKMSYAEANAVWIGAYAGISAVSNKVVTDRDQEGRGYPEFRFWNTWLKE